MIIKIIALGPQDYVKNSLNCFDGFITIISILDLGMKL